MNTQIFTRPELSAQEVSFWTTRTGTGLDFRVRAGRGVRGGHHWCCNQTLATQITRQLPPICDAQGNRLQQRLLNGIVLIEAVLVMLLAFVPALAAALGVYSVIRGETPSAGQHDRGTAWRGCSRRRC